MRPAGRPVFTLLTTAIGQLAPFCSIWGVYVGIYSADNVIQLLILDFDSVWPLCSKAIASAAGPGSVRRATGGKRMV